MEPNDGIEFNPLHEFGHPTIDESLIDVGPELYNGHDDLRRLWQDILHELTNFKYRNRKHGSKHTAESGCGGPLCKLAVREIGRARFGVKANEQNRYVDVLAKLFGEEAKRQLALAEEAALKELCGKF